MTTLTSTPTNVPLAAARVFAGLLGAVQLTGAFFFLVLAREEAVWLGPAIDVPVITLMVAGMLLKLAVAGWPGLPVDRRIRLGLVAVAIGAAMTLVKVPLYDEPEGVLFLAFDGVLLALLLLARRADRR